MNVNFTYTGLDVVQNRLRSLGDAALAMGRTTAIVGTDVRYAPFVEARYPYLAPAVEAKRGAVQARIEHAVDAVLQGGDVGQIATAFNAAGLEVQAEAQRNTHVRTGNLRRSEHTEVFSR
jgi:hypothetical protein